MENNKKPRTLAQKLLELQKVAVKLSKNEKGYDYKFVSGSKLLSFIRPAMDGLGLLLVPNTIDVKEQIVKTLDAIPPSANYKGRPEKYEVLVTLRKTFTWIDVDSGETLETTFISQGCNGWDKAVGSAETYAERYFILKFFHIATDEDDVDKVNAFRAIEDAKEQDAAETKTRGKKTAAQPAPAPAQEQPAPAPAQEQPEPQPKKEDDPAVIHAKWVRCIAEGIKTRSGKDPREAYIAAYHPDEDALASLDDEVFNYRLDHGIKAQPVNA